MLFLLWVDDHDSMMLRAIAYEQWLDQTETWLLGRRIPDSIAFASLNDLHPEQSQDVDKIPPPPSNQEGRDRAFQDIDMKLPWTPDEYLYHVLKGNRTTLPPEALDVCRFYNCHVWYKHEAYDSLLDGTVLPHREVKDMVRRGTGIIT
jgi:hypothetical protein